MSNIALLTGRSQTTETGHCIMIGCETPTVNAVVGRIDKLHMSVL